MTSARRPRILLAKTSLDGHWRGLTVVGEALRNGGFEVILLGMATVDEIVAAFKQEDVDLVGLSIGGRVEIAERAVTALRAVAPEVPIIAGGTIPPPALERLKAAGVPGFPPGSSMADIVNEARRLTNSPETPPAHDS
jgi:methylmalonyl-CoA mutase, C-terminal domain